MSTNTKYKVLVIGATGKVGGEVVRTLAEDASIETLAAVRREDQAQTMRQLGVGTVHLDLDDYQTIEKAVVGVNGILLMTGYTVDMLKQSKRVIDAAKTAGVGHIVHIGASGAATSEVSHWGWHQMIEAYVEQQGFKYTHIRPEGYMQNIFSFGWLQGDSLTNLIGDARWSWVDALDVAAVASEALRRPEEFANQVWRLGYDAATISEVAEKIGKQVGRAVKPAPLDPQVFYEGAIGAGADPAYMACIRDQFRLNAAGRIPNSDETFSFASFKQAIGRNPNTWDDFVERSMDELERT